MESFDVIVLGVGGVGSAALATLAARGARALGIDRFPPGHARGSSHGQTRMIRQAYFEHPAYVPMVLRAYELWADLERRRGTKLLTKTGLIEVGPPDGTVVRGVLDSAGQHALAVESLSRDEVMSRWPGLCVPEQFAGVFEPSAGYLRVEECVRAQADDALAHGAVLQVGESALDWQTTSNGVVVRTERATYEAARLVIAAGCWAGQLLGDLGLKLQVRRKPLYWYQAKSRDYLLERGCPAYLFELPQGVFYGFPQIDNAGVKIAEHSGGPIVADPLLVDRDIDVADQRRVEAFAADCLPGLTNRCTAHSVCMYTMTPDEHFIIDRHPDYPQVAFAAGLSGHGFKFAPVLGEALADLALNGKTDLPIQFLNCTREGLQ